MASIRRTLSPYHERSNQNGGSPFSSQSTSHKFVKASSPWLGLGKFFTGVLFLHRGSRKGYSSWKRWFFGCLVFFMVGLLLGVSPFGDLDDVRRLDFSFETSHSPVVVDDREEVTKEVSVIHGEENYVVDAVELGVRRDQLIERFDFTPRKQLIVVTPTYNRALQAYYLNRLGQVLRLMPPPILWIVVEMSAASLETAEILRETGVTYRHLVCSINMTSIKDRGVHQRNTALEHIERHKLDGIVYFADDDNIYSLELFENLRATRRFSIWPVAMLAHSKNKAILEGPVCNGSQVIGWHTNEKSKRLRRFHIDMSGFAFNSTILWDPKRWHRPISDPIRQLDTVKEGFQETTFIEQVVEDESQMEGIPSDCSKIMNWHLHLESSELVYPRGWLIQENLDALMPIKL